MFHFNKASQPPEHTVYNSVAQYVEMRANLSEENSPMVFDKIVLKFDSPIDSAFGHSEVIDVKIKDTDLDKATCEVSPVGSSIKDHPIILKEKQLEEETKKTIKTSARRKKTGNSIDPDGSKVGEKQKNDATVSADHDYIKPYINMLVFLTTTTKTRDEAIAAIFPLLLVNGKKLPFICCH